jgi:phage shock protein E
LVIDVRSQGEFSGDHIDGAVNIPYDLISHEIGKYASDKDQTIILYCHSGARAAAAAKSLIQAGYTRIVNAATLRKMRKILDQ